MKDRRLASVSLDLDNKWSYLKTHGDPDWRSFPSYLDVLLPMVLDLLGRHSLQITFFVVGQDAALVENAQLFSMLGASGHEIANHSFHHEPWLHRKSSEEIRLELKDAHEAIGAATTQSPEGFRGPGFSLSEDTLLTLSDLGYRYDASTLPTFIGPLARAYYFRTAKLPPEARIERQQLFGSSREFFRPNTPYRWRLPGREVIEIPVTTLPWLRVPFHFSYLIYLASYSERLARAYFQTALTACRAASVEPSLLLHPLDFLGADDVSGLGFFPGMKLDGAFKRRLVSEYLDRLAANFSVLAVGRHVEKIASRELPTRKFPPASPLGGQ
ncbi:MAG: polysaccharide deacetylase family protein [Acidimicrobiia bacterium]